MAEITHEIKIKAPQEQIYGALTTLPGLAGWHSAKVKGDAGPQGVIAFESHFRPSFEWEVAVLKKPDLVEWTCIQGPGNSVGTTARFVLSSLPDHRTLVELSHSGWADTGGNFRKCNTLWGILLHHLRKYSETGKADPAFA